MACWAREMLRLHSTVFRYIGPVAKRLKFTFTIVVMGHGGHPPREIMDGYSQEHV